MRPKFIVTTVLFMVLAAGSVLAQTGGLYNLTWSSIDGGGGESSGGDFTLRGTVGQPEANEVLSGGVYNLVGGFWKLPAPVVISPSNQAPGRNYFTIRSITLTWLAVPGAIGYEVQVATNLGFTNIIWSDNTLSATTLNATTDVLPNGIFYWRVHAKASATTFGAWSIVESFTVNAP